MTGLDGVEELVARSLVLREAVDGWSRYRLLELVREYAAGKLDAAGERGAVEHRHRDWALAYVAAAPDPLGGGRVGYLLAEYPNLRAALRRAIAQRDSAVALHLATELIAVWFNLGPLTEGARLVDTVLELAEGPCADRYYLTIDSCYLWMWQGEKQRAAERAERARAMAPACLDVRSPHLAEILLAVLSTGDPPVALELLRSARAGAVAMGYRADEGFADFVEATVHLWDGDVGRARHLLDRALEVPLSPDAGWVVVAEVARLALLVGERDPDAPAEARRLVAELPDHGNVALVITTRSLAAVALDDRALLADAVERSRQRRGAVLGVCLLAAAALEAHAGRWDAAGRLLGAARGAPDLGLSARWGEVVARRLGVEAIGVLGRSRWEAVQAEGVSADPEALVAAAADS